jgi:hypothetical protein
MYSCLRGSMLWRCMEETKLVSSWQIVNIRNIDNDNIKCRMWKCIVLLVTECIFIFMFCEEMCQDEKHNAWPHGLLDMTSHYERPLHRLQKSFEMNRWEISIFIHGDQRSGLVAETRCPLSTGLWICCVEAVMCCSECSVLQNWIS